MRCKSFKIYKLSFWLIIANSRHFIMLDQPDAFANALGGVLTADRGGRDR